MSPEKQAVLDALTAERYGPSLWWQTPEPPDDNEMTQRWRRKLMEQDFGLSTGSVTVPPHAVVPPDDGRMDEVLA